MSDEKEEARVIGIGGVFFRSRDPAALQAWYAEHLGLPVHADGAVVLPWQRADGTATPESTIWAPFAQDTDYFGPGGSQLMVNLIVSDLDGMLTRLRAAGIEVLPDVEEMSYGRFGWFVDPDGRRVELWEPMR